jgi:hypothetical protein
MNNTQLALGIEFLFSAKEVTEYNTFYIHFNKIHIMNLKLCYYDLFVYI